MPKTKVANMKGSPPTKLTVRIVVRPENPYITLLPKSPDRLLSIPKKMRSSKNNLNQLQDRFLKLKKKPTFKIFPKAV